MSLALNYEPEVVVNIETLTREEWLDYRRLGIGGSDVAAIMGISPFATIKDPGELIKIENWREINDEVQIHT